MIPLADHVYYVGIVSKNLTSFAMTWACIHFCDFSSNSFVILFVEFSFWDNVSCNINHTYMYFMISKNTYAEIFFQINYLYFLFFIFFYPKILRCVEINLFEFRSQVKSPHVTEVWVNFTTQLGLFIKIWIENTFFYMWLRTVALKVQKHDNKQNFDCSRVKNVSVCHCTILSPASLISEYSWIEKHFC